MNLVKIKIDNKVIEKQIGLVIDEGCQLQANGRRGN